MVQMCANFKSFTTKSNNYKQSARVAILMEVIMEKKYFVKMIAYICVTDAERIINWAEQGWEWERNDDYHSLMLYLYHCEEITTNRIEEYVEAFNKLNHDIQIESYVEVIE